MLGRFATLQFEMKQKILYGIQTRKIMLIRIIVSNVHLSLTWSDTLETDFLVMRTNMAKTSDVDKKMKHCN